MVALDEGRAVRCEDDAADARVRPEGYAGGGGQLEGAAHRVVLFARESHGSLKGPVADSRGCQRALSVLEGADR
ncbi:hypothetical protein GCM10011584_26570 [Nocardioides phosphati]|uniref:Uncharacterized protein n=1 Tax=Nocardioides phosphati TaxID=1867775 RepID=A0ABQ2NE73_9ACTN|nr:hypothetical protein GCM10011584_26570 [Nocardioides phosphati]